MSNSSRQYRRHGIQVESYDEYAERLRSYGLRGWRWIAYAVLAIVLAVICSLLIVPKAAAQRTTNTFNVYDFRLSASQQNVGAMATAAQNQCNADTAYPCVIIFDPILAEFPLGTMPARCSSCIWLDYRTPGAFTISGSNIGNSSGRRDCTQYTGSDIGIKCNAAIADFGAAPACGEIYVPAGNYSFTTGINIVGRNGCVFRGAGKTQTKLNYTGSGTAFNYDNSSAGLGEFALYNLTFDGTGSTGATGFKELAGYWALLEDVDVTSFSVDCKFDGNHANGTNVVILMGVRCYNASTTAIWLTGPNLTGQGSYNLVMYGGQANCSTTTGTDGILIDGKSTNNKFDFPLINNCARGVHDASIGNNTFRDISVQGNTIGTQVDATATSDFFDGGYYFSNGTQFIDNGVETTVVNDGVNGAGSIIHQPFRASPYRGGGAESNFTVDLNGTNVRACTFSITGGGAWFPMCFENRNSGHLSIMRADAQALPIFGGALTNYQPVFDESPTGTAQFSDNTGAVKFTVDASANLFTMAGKTFATLGTPANGNFIYCSDCTIANPCAGSGTGALAKRLNGIWVCN